jgi:uncharacterized protein (DUF58 family)
MAAASTWGLVRFAAASRWALSRWPRRPELDGTVPTTRWGRFRHRGGVSGHIHDAFRRRLTPAGKVLCGVWFTTFAVSRIPGTSLADVAFALLASAMTVAWLLSWRRPTLSCDWSLEGPVSAGSRSWLRLELRNTGTRTLRDPGAWFFRCADGLDLPGDGAHVETLEPGRSVVLRIPVAGRMRGPAFLDAPHLLSVEPLGLMRASRRGSGAGEIAVRPGVPRMLSLRFLALGASGPAFAPWIGPRSDRSGDPAGVREYRDGDSLRDLHHRSWARRGKPVTRERTAGRGDGIRLEISTAVRGIEGRMLVDGMLALACSSAGWLAARGALGSVWIDGSRLETGSDPVEALLEACARLPRAGWKSWTSAPWTPPPVDARTPLLVVAASLPEAGARPGSAKFMVPDWTSESVTIDAAGAVLGYRPDLPFRPEIRL